VVCFGRGREIIGLFSPRISLFFIPEKRLIFFSKEPLCDDTLKEQQQHATTTKESTSAARGEREDGFSGEG